MRKLLLFLARNQLLRRLINPRYNKVVKVEKGTIAIVPCVYFGLGDMVMYGCSILQLKERYTVLFIVPEMFYIKFSSFFKDHSLIEGEDILILPLKRRKWPAFLRQMKARNIQAVIHDDLPTVREVFSYLAGVPIIVSTSGSSPFANREYSINPPTHYIGRANLIFGFLGVEKMEHQIAPFLRYQRIEMPELNGFDGVTLAVHSGGAAYWNRKWPQDNYYETLRRFLQHYHGRILLIGGKEEYEGNETLRSRLLCDGYTSDRVLNFCGVPLNTSFNVMARADVFLGNDSGPLHCAVALNCRVISIFGPSNIPVVNPTQYDPRNFTIHTDLECVPCISTSCRLEDDKKFMCLTTLAVEPVWRALQTTLKDHLRSGSLSDQSPVAKNV